jgi:hypothetical protein
MLCAFAINQAISAAVAEVRPCRAVPGVLVLAPLWPGLPLPSDHATMASAVAAGLLMVPAVIPPRSTRGAGQLNIALVVLIGFLAAVAGDNVGFVIGHVGGRSLILHFGRYVLLTEDRLAKAEGFLTRHGGKVVTVARSPQRRVVSAQPVDDVDQAVRAEYLNAFDQRCLSQRGRGHTRFGPGVRHTVAFRAAPRWSGSIPRRGASGLSVK